MTIVDVMAQAALYTGAAGLLVKGIIDAIKRAYDTPRWVAPVLAFLGGPALVALFMVAQATVWTPSSAALCVIAGLLAGLSAIGVTQLQQAEKGGPAEQLQQAKETGIVPREEN